MFDMAKKRDRERQIFSKTCARNVQYVCVTVSLNAQRENKLDERQVIEKSETTNTISEVSPSKSRAREHKNTQTKFVKRSLYFSFGFVVFFFPFLFSLFLALHVFYSFHSFFQLK